MPKHKEPSREEGSDPISIPSSYEHYHGMNDTTLEGGDALRLALAEQYQAMNAILAGDTPSLYAIEAKKMLDGIGEEIDHFDQTKDPDAREEIYHEITELLSLAMRYVVSGEQATTDEGGNLLRVKSLEDLKKATLIIPPDWDDPSKPLN